MKDKKQKLTGPKFREYFMLHVKRVKWYIIWGVAFGLFVGRLWGDFDDSWDISLYILLIFAVIWREIGKVCSGMLYQREAYLYQSFPVTNFDTILTKTLTVALLIIVQVSCTVVVMYGVKGVMMIPAIVSGGLLTGDIILAAIGFGNSIRDSRAKKPSTWGSLIAAVAMLGAQVGLTAAFVKWVPLSFGLKTLVLTVVFAAEAAGMLWYNTNSLKRNYQV